MFGANSLKEIVEEEINGKIRYSVFRKTPSQTTTAGIWFDLAMSPGYPSPKFWFDATPLQARQISQSTDGGIFHGANVSPFKKIIRTISALSSSSTPLPLTLILMDYLLYYPSIDEGTTEEQIMDNTLTLPRYTDGKGVYMMAVSIANRTGGQSFVVKYTNQNGVEGRLTSPIVQNSSTAIGSIVSSATATNGAFGPFLPFQSGDTGVRKIESVQMLGEDVGLFSIVLVKPLCIINIREQTAPVEKDMFKDFGVLPEVKDNAFLGFVCLPSGNLAGVHLMGELKILFL